MKLKFLLVELPLAEAVLVSYLREECVGWGGGGDFGSIAYIEKKFFFVIIN